MNAPLTIPTVEFDAGERSDVDLVDEARALVAKLILRWYNDPVQFAWDVFGVQLWKAQRVICKAIAKASKAPVRIAVKSGHKIGKSLLIAVVALWWWITRPGARVIMTAPTARQIRSTLWREVKKLWGVATERLKAIGGLGGRLHEIPEMGLQHIEAGTQSEVIGFATSQPEKMAGTSGENLLYLVDEASGVRAPIFEAMDGNRAGGASAMLFSNPTQTSGEFFDAFHGKKRLYITFTFSSEDTPNTRCGRKVVPGLATRAWVQEKREEWGPDWDNDPRYRVRVKGEFPLNASDQVISLAHVLCAKRAWFEFAAKIFKREELLVNPDEWPRIIRDGAELAIVRGAWQAGNEPLAIGVDPAHYGDDLTVIYPRRGLRVFRPTVLKHGDGKDVADAVLEIVRDQRRGLFEIPQVLLDVIGVGVSTFDHLKASREIKLKPVNSGRPPTEGQEDEYLNLRSEIAFGVRRWIRLGGGFEPDDRLEKDLLAPRYSLDKVGRVQVEAKKELKKRLGSSPDYGDALGLGVFDGALKPTVIHLPQIKRPLRFGEQEGRGYG